MNSDEVDKLITWIKGERIQCESDRKELDSLKLNPDQRARIGMHIDKRKLELDRLEQIVAAHAPVPPGYAVAQPPSRPDMLPPRTGKGPRGS